MPKLEDQIAAWRRQMAAGGIQTPVILDELESHLREEVDIRLACGDSEARAFEHAAKWIGNPGSLRTEFSKISGTTSLPVVIGASVWTGAAILIAVLLTRKLYLILRVGKLALGRQRITLTGDTKIVFTDTALVLPEKEIPYADLFYRKSDVIALQARTVELAGRSYQNVPVRLTPTSLQIGHDKFNPAAVTRMEAVSTEIILPCEAMGFGDVKFLAAIGAFLGWQAAIFSLVASSLLGSLVGLIAARRREWSSRLPYGPYIASAAVIWIFGGKHFVETMFAP